MKRLEDENHNLQNISGGASDIRMTKTQQNFMKRELSLSNFGNRRKSSIKGQAFRLEELKERRIDDDTHLPDSSFESGDTPPGSD